MDINEELIKLYQANQTARQANQGQVGSLSQRLQQIESGGLEDLTAAQGEIMGMGKTFTPGMSPLDYLTASLQSRNIYDTKREKAQRELETATGKESGLAKEGIDILKQLQDIGKQSSSVDELLKQRKGLQEAGFSTSIIDEELKKRGLSKTSEVGQDVSKQIEGLTGAVKTEALAVKDIYDVIDAAQKKYAEMGKGLGRAFVGEGTGPLSALTALLGKTVGKETKTNQLNKDLSEILRTIRKESTGVAFSPQEIKDLEKEIPTIFQQEATVEDGLRRLKQRMAQKLSNRGIVIPTDTTPTTQTGLDQYDEDLINKYKGK